MAANDNRKRLFALALAKGHKVEEAAEQANISETTGYRWLKNDPAVKREVAELQAEATATAMGLLSALSRKAAATLGKLLDGQSEMVRLSAARAIIELHVRLKESVEIERRLAELEEAQQRGQGMRRVR